MFIRTSVSIPRPDPPSPAARLAEAITLLVGAILGGPWGLWRFFPAARRLRREMEQFARDFAALMDRLAAGLPELPPQPAAPAAPVAAPAPRAARPRGPSRRRARAQTSRTRPQPAPISATPSPRPPVAHAREDAPSFPAFPPPQPDPPVPRPRRPMRAAVVPRRFAPG
jgi:hypothetical protein